MPQKILESAKIAIFECNRLHDLQALKPELIGKSSPITQEMRKLSSMSNEERKEFGAIINNIKIEIVKLLEQRTKELQYKEMEEGFVREKIDMTLPSRKRSLGTIHPISQVMEELIQIFSKYGFKVETGPDIESQWYNFTALNIAENHPARQMHDSFYFKGDSGKMLRTHTSPIQIRTCLNQSSQMPLRFIAPGRTYRADSDATHTPMFHQIEGMCIDKNVNMSNLKYIIIDFIHSFFENANMEIRFRPSFFPFTEPSAEVDIRMGNSQKWLEVLGCGMVHPKVLANVNIDSKTYQGFAFGLGVERFAMLKYGMKDLRQFFDGDKRWLNHYNFFALNIPNIVGGLSK